MNQRTCTHCGADISHTHGGRVYCDARCREAARYQRMRQDPEAWDAYLTKLRNKYTPKPRQQRPPHVPTPCNAPDCDRPSASRGMCRMHYRRWERANGMANPPSDQWSLQRRAVWKKRHAVKRGADRYQAETIFTDSIYERDGWICQLCNEPVDKALEFPNQMSASLDHRLPLSVGGTHARQRTTGPHQVQHPKGIKGSRDVAQRGLRPTGTPPQAPPQETSGC